MKRIVSKVVYWAKNNKLITSLFIIAAAVHLAVVFFNGSYTCVNKACGLYIGGLHFHDSLWHLALANVAFNTFPFQLPIYAGTPLQGYNYFLDLLMFLLTKVGISALVSYFKLIPIVTLGLLFVFTYRYAQKINKSQIFIACILFFIFFGSSFSYVLSLYHFKTLSSYFYAQAMQSGRMFLNIQYAVSLLPFFGVLLILQQKKFTLWSTLLIGFFVFLTSILKIYGGIVLLFLVLVDFFLSFLQTKKITAWLFRSLAVSFFFVLSIILFYNPFQSMKTGAIFTLAPFALSRQMIEAQDMFYMPQLVLARYYLQSINLHSPRLLAIELFSVVIFILYNFGTRIVGLIYFIRQLVRNKLRKDEVVLFLTIIFSSCLTLLLVQKGDWWNVIQFFGYTLLLMNYFAGSFLYSLIKSKKTLLVALSLIIVLLTLPTNVEQLGFAFERRPSISQAELSALSFIKNDKSEGIILTLPIQETAYVSAFSYHKEFYNDIKQLNLLGVDTKERVDQLKSIERGIIPTGVTYLYIKKGEYKSKIYDVSFTPVYENSDVLVLKRK